MTEYYIEFITWAEGGFENPWPVIIFEQTNQYRNRNNLSIPISNATLQGVFLSFNENACAKFLDEHVRGTILGALITCHDIEAAHKELLNVFKSCEILDYCIVDESNKELIYERINSAGIPPSAV